MSVTAIFTIRLASGTTREERIPVTYEPGNSQLSDNGQFVEAEGNFVRNYLGNLDNYKLPDNALVLVDTFVIQEGSVSSNPYNFAGALRPAGAGSVGAPPVPSPGEIRAVVRVDGTPGLIGWGYDAAAGRMRLYFRTSPTDTNWQPVVASAGAGAPARRPAGDGGAPRPPNSAQPVQSMPSGSPPTSSRPPRDHGGSGQGAHPRPASSSGAIRD